MRCICKQDFRSQLVFSDQYSEEFKTFALSVVYDVKKCKYKIPSKNIEGDIRVYINNQNIFDSGAFIKYLYGIYSN
jgi:hypothetical protein